MLTGAGHVKTFDGLVPLLLVVEWMRLLLVCNINFHLNSQLTELFSNNNHHPGSNQKKTTARRFISKQNFRTACVSSSNCVSNGIQSPTRWPGGVGRKPPPGLAVSTSPSPTCSCGRESAVIITIISKPVNWSMFSTKHEVVCVFFWSEVMLTKNFDACWLAHTTYTCMMY